VSQYRPATLHYNLQQNSAFCRSLSQLAAPLFAAKLRILPHYDLSQNSTFTTAQPLSSHLIPQGPRAMCTSSANLFSYSCPRLAVPYTTSLNFHLILYLANQSTLPLELLTYASSVIVTKCKYSSVCWPYIHNERRQTQPDIQPLSSSD
jgi:hypothetical protein